MTIKITKQLATVEDLAIGTGTVVQERNGVQLTLTKIDLITRTELAGNPADGLGAALVNGIAISGISELGLAADGVADDTVNFLAMAESLKDSGKGVRTKAGDIIHITAPVTIEGFSFELVAGSSIKISGSDAAVFTGGAVIVGENAELTGNGDLFTSGVLTYANGSHTVRQIGGTVSGNLTVYSQFDEVFVHFRGDCRVKIVGGYKRGFRSRLNLDQDTCLEIDYFNVGIRYTDKLILTPIVLPPDSRAVHIYPSIPIFSTVKATINGRYCWKNGAWLGYAGSGNDNSVDLKNLITEGYISKPGFYLDETGAENLGHGAGTCWEIEGAPNSIINGSSDGPRGYNVAIVGGSHGAVSNGRHIGVGGDPNCVVVNSDDVIVGGILINGTVGVSVGEDGAQADNCVISARIINAINEPVRVSAAKNTRLSSAVVEGITAGSGNGSWSGLGEVSPAVRVMTQAGGNDVTIENTTISGPYTHDVIEKGAGGNGGLRVIRSSNTYACSIIPHNETEMQNLLGLMNPGSSRFTPLTDVSPSGGYANTGEITITEAGGATYAYTSVNTRFADLDSYVKGGDTLAETLKQFYVLWYFRYDAAMPYTSSRFVRFGLASDFNIVHAPLSFYSISTAYEAMLGRSLKDGEYLPMRAPFNSSIYSSADTADLNFFFVTLDDAPVGYDVVITAPVVVEVPVYLTKVR